MKLLLRPHTIIKIETIEPLELFPNDERGQPTTTDAAPPYNTNAPTIQLVSLKNEKSDQLVMLTTTEESPKFDQRPLLGPTRTGHQNNKVESFRKSISIPTDESIAEIENAIDADNFDVNDDELKRLAIENNVTDIKTVIFNEIHISSAFSRFIQWFYIIFASFIHFLAIRQFLRN